MVGGIVCATDGRDTLGLVKSFRWPVFTFSAASGRYRRSLSGVWIEFGFRSKSWSVTCNDSYVANLGYLKFRIMQIDLLVKSIW